MGRGSNHGFEPEASGYDTAAIEVCKRRKSRICSGIRVRVRGSRKSKRRRPNIRDVSRQTAKCPLQSYGPGLQESIAETPVNPTQTEQRELMTRSQCCQILLVAIHVHHSV